MKPKSMASNAATANDIGESDSNRQQAVFVVDDSTTYLTVARAVVEASPGFELVGTAMSVESAIEAIGGLASPPDLVLLDINLGTGSGIDVAMALEAGRPNMKIVLVSTLSPDDLPDDARRCGAAGYLPKIELSPSNLRAAADGAYDWPR